MNSITSSSKVRSLITGAILSALAVGFSVECVAADYTDVRQVTVKYEDLNASTQQGAAVLYGRIRHAADIVCPSLWPSELTAQVRREVCMRKSIADAVIAVNEPALIAQYNANNREPLPIMLAAGQTR